MDAGVSDTDAGAGTDAGLGDDAGPIGDDAGGPTDAAVDSGPVSMPCTATGACDPFDPSACPSGEKCRVTASGTECQALTMTPPLVEGDVCAQELECGPTLWCVSFDGEFRCTPMCANGSIGECGADAACTGTVGIESCVRACRDLPARCNIYTQDCGDASMMCAFTTNPESGENYTGCRPAGTLNLGEACGGSLGRCVGGLVCIRQDGETTCRQVCGPDGSEPTCASGACTGLARSWGVPYCR